MRIMDETDFVNYHNAPHSLASDPDDWKSLPPTPSETVPLPGRAACTFCKQLYRTCRGEVIRKGCDRYPHWRCKRCHAACSRIERAAVTAEQKQQLRLLRQQRAWFASQVVKFASSQVLGATQRYELQQFFPASF